MPINKQGSKFNFIVTGSILGGRGVEALATLQELLRLGDAGRCLIVVWEDETHTPAFEAIKALPLEVLVIPPPSLQASGNMTRQHLSFVSALPFFEPDDFIVRVRTDHNCRLKAIMDHLVENGPETGKVIVGAVSLLLPGRVEDFNYAGYRRDFDHFMWCESYFTEDYLPRMNKPGLGGQPYFSAEPELRWAGLYYAMKNPLFSFLYAKYNRYDFAYKFIEKHVKRKPCLPHNFPPIATYLMWKAANSYREDFLVVRDKPTLPAEPDALFSFADESLSQLVDLPNNKDIRISCQPVVDTVAGWGELSEQWQEFLAPALQLEAREKTSPGTVIDELERYMASAAPNGPVYMDHRPMAQEKAATQGLLSVANQISQHEPFSTLRYAKSKLLAVRTATDSEVEALVAQYDLSGGVAGQHMDGFAAFFATLVSKLIDMERNTQALQILETVFSESAHTIEQFIDTLKNCTTCYASDTNLQGISCDKEIVKRAYELPDNFHEYHLLGDFIFHALKLWQKYPQNELLIRLKDRLESEKGFHLNSS